MWLSTRYKPSMGPPNSTQTGWVGRSERNLAIPDRYVKSALATCAPVDYQPLTSVMRIGATCSARPSNVQMTCVTNRLRDRSDATIMSSSGWAE